MISRWLMMVAMLGMVSANFALAQQQTRQPGQPQAGQQQAGQQREQRQAADEAQARAGRQLDQRLAMLLMLDNQAEVAISQFAQERATTDVVRDFAQKMVKEHSELQEKLQQIALRPGQRQRGETGATPRGEGPARREATDTQQQAGQQRADQQQAGQRRADQQQEGQRQADQQQAGQRRADQQQAGQRQAGQQARQQQDRLLAVAQEAAEQFTELTKKELGRHEGIQFDVAFMGQQIVVHLASLARLNAMQDHVSQDLQPIVKQAAESTEQHLAEARKIMEQLETQVAATARRDQPVRQQQQQPRREQ